MLLFFLPAKETRMREEVLAYGFRPGRCTAVGCQRRRCRSRCTRPAAPSLWGCPCRPGRRYTTCRSRPAHTVTFPFQTDGAALEMPGEIGWRFVRKNKYLVFLLDFAHFLDQFKSLKHKMPSGLFIQAFTTSFRRAKVLHKRLKVNQRNK